VFYSQLSFLHKVIKSKYTWSNMKEAAADGEEATTISPGPNVERNKRKKVEQVSPDVAQLVNVLPAGIQSREEREKSKENNGDRLLLLSLLKPMTQIPAHLRFSVRIQMMQVIENVYTRAMSSNLITNHPQQPKLQYQFSQQPQRKLPQQLPEQHFNPTTARYASTFYSSSFSRVNYFSRNPIQLCLRN
jgi:hypothetical protein